MPFASELNEQEVATTAVELVERGQLRRPTMRAVARELDVSAGTLYQYFPSLETLDTRAGRWAASMLFAAIPIRLLRFANPRVKVDERMLEEFALHYLCFAIENPRLYRLITPDERDGRFTSGPRGDCYVWRRILLLVSRFTGHKEDVDGALGFWSLLHGYATVECPYSRLPRSLEFVPPGVSVYVQAPCRTGESSPPNGRLG